MKFAIPLSILPSEELLPLTIEAEKAGFNAIAVSDHLIHPKNVRNKLLNLHLVQ